MPKIKTKRAAAKRFKVKGNGRITRAQACKRHNTGKKPPSTKRRLRKILTVSGCNRKEAKAMLPNSL
ncbi:MAG: 50S ribosomal protein L35 [Candidatus Dadabacteria bacterium]|nr:MAG: 50S ribosomal protein L35 [Candidatus Dadabacteria bacterium]